MAKTIATKKKGQAQPGSRGNKKDANQAAFPENLSPMLATLTDGITEDEDWVYEVKWDGYRALGYVRNGVAELRSRNNKSFNEKFYPVFEALQQWSDDAVVDGEIIVVNDKGISDFSDLQNWRSEADGHLVYYLFDLLWYNGKDLMNLPLVERKEILRKCIPDSPVLQLSENFDASGKEFFELAGKLGLEGIIAKRPQSTYRPGIRSREWLKIKTENRQEAIIGGYTKNEGSSKKFSALLLGIMEDGQFNFIGTVGTGFTVKLQQEILEKLKPLEMVKCPFASEPEYNKPSRFRPNPPKAAVTWVKPEVVVEISYREMTRDGAIRHPSFKGLRDDKSAAEVIRETPVTHAASDDSEKLSKAKVLRSPEKSDRKTLLNPRDETQVRSIGGTDLKFTNLSKIFWPKEKYTKRDMLNYYFQVAPFILPHLLDRPQTLNRHPNGIEGKSFYQKDVKGKVPSWLNVFHFYSTADEREKDFPVCTDEKSLLYIASLGCIELNPWHSRTQSPDNPDYCIIDLDPDQNAFSQVIETAKVTKEILDAAGADCFCKTSGSTGLHIYIPFGAKYSYEDSREFGRTIATLVHRELPKFTSIERKTANRKGKIYVDFLQNRPQATVSSAYSLRPKPGATVSMPLHWSEVKKGLKLSDFNLKNSISRIRKTGDLFAGVLGPGIDLNRALSKLSAL